MKDIYRYAMIYRKLHRKERKYVDFKEIIVKDEFYMNPIKAPPDMMYRTYAKEEARRIRMLPECKKNLEVKKLAYKLIVHPEKKAYSLLMGLRSYACLRELDVNKVKVFVVIDYPSRDLFENMLLKNFILREKGG